MQPPDPRYDRVVGVGAALEALARLAADAGALDAHTTAGIAAILELLAGELEDVAGELENLPLAA